MFAKKLQELWEQLRQRYAVPPGALAVAIAIVAGADKIAVITDGGALANGASTKTRIPTQTPMTFPTVTPRLSSNTLLANQIGWFAMNDEVPFIERLLSLGANIII